MELDTHINDTLLGPEDALPPLEEGEALLGPPEDEEPSETPPKPETDPLAAARAAFAVEKAELAAARTALAFEREQLERRKYKHKRAARLKELAPHVDPETDPLFTGCGGDFAAYHRKAVEQAHLDGGPAAKGEVAPAYLLFERRTPKQIEAKWDERMAKLHHHGARAWNAYRWHLLVAEKGLAEARRLKDGMKWIPLRRFDHLDLDTPSSEVST